MATRQDKADAVLLALDSVFEIVIAWSPSATRPVTVIYLKVDDVTLVHDRLAVDSPLSVPLPAAKVGNPVRLRWAIAPEVDVDTIAIGFSRRGREGTKKVAGKDGLERSDVWEDAKDVTVS